MTDLRSIVSRIERIREEKKALTADERDIFTEAKSSGLDGKALRKVLQRRAMGDAAVAELDAIVDAYEAALGGKLVAAEALKAGASVRQAAKAAGVSVSTAQRTKNQVSEPDRAATSSAPAGGGGKGVAQAMPPRPEPMDRDTETASAATPAPGSVAAERTQDSAMAVSRAADPVKPSHGGNGTPQVSGVTAGETAPISESPAGAPYRPSNGMEAALFMAAFCDRCERDAAYRRDPDRNDSCPIAAATMAFRVTDPGYPGEWVRGSDGEGKCTAFSPVGEGPPPRPEPIPQSEAAVPTRGISRGKPAEVASDTASPAGASPPNCAADCDPAPDAASPRSGPAGETDLTIPPHLRRGTAANARARGLA